MPGTELNLVLPSLSDSLATIVSKIAAALAAIDTDLAPLITAGELNINAGVSFNGNPLTGLGSATLVSGSIPTAPGSIYYNAGEFYAIDSTGTVKLTQLGTIAVAGVKGIGGDYGNVGNSALVYFDNASGEYRFYDGTGTGRAPLVSGYHTIYNAGGTHFVRLRASASATGDYDMTLPVAQPATANSVMIFSAANPSVAQFQSPSTFVRTTSGIPGFVSTNQITQVVHASAGVPATTVTPWTYGGSYWTTTAATAGVEIPISIPVGAVLTAWQVAMVKSSATGQLIANITGIDNTGAGSGVAGASPQGNSGVSPGAIILGQSGLSFTIPASKSYYFSITKTTGVTGDLLLWATFTYYMP